jgi:hypothetical protein
VLLSAEHGVSERADDSEIASLDDGSCGHAKVKVMGTLCT